MKAALNALVIALLFSFHAHAQVTRVEPYVDQPSSGVCSVTRSQATATPSGNYATLNFKCSGTFPGRVTAAVFVESTTAPATVDPYGRVTSGVVYDSMVLTWPRTVRNCTLGVCGPWYTEEIPDSYSMTAVAPAWIGTLWQGRMFISYDATVCSTGCRSVVRKSTSTVDAVWTY